MGDIENMVFLRSETRLVCGLNKNLPRTRTVIPRELLVQFLVETLFSVLLWWFESAPKLSPRDADAMFRRLVLPTLKHNQPT
ncbi:MAG: hypothetical protein ABIO94_04105 [Opitutaceae bacterium]